MLCACSNVVWRNEGEVEKNRASEGRTEGLALFVCGAILFLLLGCLWRPVPVIRMIDFDAVYYASQTLLHHADPYNHSELERVYFSSGSRTPPSQQNPKLAEAVTECVNLPTSLMLMAPLAQVPWRTAHLIWMTITAAGLLLSSFLMWKVGAMYAPRLTGLLLGSMLLGSQILLEVGNSAGIAVSLCVIAVWCIVQERFVWLGVVCMALSLSLKPQDAGFVWLFFLIASSSYRRRAWQVLGVCILLLVPAVLWVSSVSPHWAQELQANIALTSVPSGGNDPGSTSAEPAVHASMMVNLQTVFRLFSADPQIYNGLSYLVCLPLLLLWGFVVLRSTPTVQQAWIALAAIAPLAMLPVYHRQHDTRLLLLVIPACAIFAARSGKSGRLAVILTVAGSLFTGNIPLQIVGILTYPIRSSLHGISGELLIAAVARPASLIMLAMSGLNLWLYVRLVLRKTATPRTSTSEERLMAVGRLYRRVNRSPLRG